MGLSCPARAIALLLSALYPLPALATNLVVDGTTVSLWNWLTYDEVTITNGGRIAVPQLNSSGQGGWLTIEADRITIDAGSGIFADGSGYNWNCGYRGPGEGTSNWNQYYQYISASGGGYGGAGGYSSWTAGFGGSAYGSPTVPDYETGSMGSAGGGYYYVIDDWLQLDALRYGGAGGGGIELRAREIVLDGTLSCNGDPGQKAIFPYIGEVQYGSGGGSGGEIILSATESLRLGPQGVLSAVGGNGSSPNEVDSSGGGGGGRIKMSAGNGYTNLAGLNAFRYGGGIGGDHYADGDSGSLSVVTLPEPSTFGLLVLSAVGILRRKAQVRCLP